MINNRSNFSKFVTTFIAVIWILTIFGIIATFGIVVYLLINPDVIGQFVGSIQTGYEGTRQ